MQKRWKIVEPEPGKIAELKESLSISSTLCNILIQRGIDTFEKAKNYFRPQLSQLHDPFLMKDMGKAVERILFAINNQQKILVFGDYDVDGTTSVALMYRFLKKIYCEENIAF
ncbi:MAG TPA: single-stranded-DNA-specific exonuclease RecJ, partial [Hanamia sp.]